MRGRSKYLDSTDASVSDGGCGCQVRSSYHPANRTLFVHPAARKPPAIETITQTTAHNPRRWHMPYKQEARDVQRYKKLISCCQLLPDLAADVTYFRPKDQEMGSTAYISYTGVKNAVTLVPQLPIQLPSCCSRHRGEVHQVVLQHKKLLYNSPEPPPMPNMHRLKDKLERLVDQSLNQNSLRQYPLDSIHLRWHTAGAYTVAKLWSMMEKYGSVSRIHILSPCSAVVVYNQMANACKPVNLRFIGSQPGSRIFCEWLHDTMKARAVARPNSTLKFVHNTRNT